MSMRQKVVAPDCHNTISQGAGKSKFDLCGEGWPSCGGDCGHQLRER